MSDIAEFVKPDVIHQVPIQGGVLQLSPAHDFIIHWEANGAWMLKYWNQDIEPPKMCNIPINEAQARFLISACELEVCERHVMREQEHQHYLAWASLNALAELDFEPEIEEQGELNFGGEDEQA